MKLMPEKDAVIGYLILAVLISAFVGTVLLQPVLAKAPILHYIVNGTMYVTLTVIIIIAVMLVCFVVYEFAHRFLRNNWFSLYYKRKVLEEKQRIEDLESKTNEK